MYQKNVIFLSNLNKVVSFCWLPSHVGISGNERADAAAKSALSLSIADIKIPYTDLKQRINSHLVNKWQIEWNNVPFNKLQPIKKTLGETKFKDIVKRRDELVLHRVRVGHTYLTHRFLLKGEDQPECIPCQSPLTVEHILLHCIDFSLIRQKYFNVTTLNELFHSISPFMIVNFLKEIGLYSKIQYKLLLNHFVHISIYIFISHNFYSFYFFVLTFLIIKLYCNSFVFISSCVVNF